MYKLLNVIELFSFLQTVLPYNGFTINEFATLANYFGWASRHTQRTTIYIYMFANLYNYNTLEFCNVEKRLNSKMFS